MFTGIIEETGKVLSLKDVDGKKRLTVGSSQLVRDLKKGDSIAVSGVCLTAIVIGRDSFGADLAHETVERTSFTRLRPDAIVNLELPARADGRLGGHIVQGHVDGVGKLVSLKRVENGEDFWLEVEIPAGLARYVVWKGSIAIEGISLTVAKVDGNIIGIAIIPHTREATNLHSLKPGDPLNIETDIIAKYAEKMLKGDGQGEAVTVEKLVRQGF